MKIIYKQAMHSEGYLSKPALLEGFGITGCYYKAVIPSRDSSSITTQASMLAISM